jgi:Tol biopolymer transport system component
MIFRLQIIFVVALFITLAGCSSNNNPTNTVNGLKGFIYYSTAGEIYRINLVDQITKKLFTNARHPDVMDNGQILAVETYPNTRIIYTDITGANRTSLIVSESYIGPLYKYYLNRPRISYNQNYVAYEGDNVYNPNSYIVNASDGSLVVTIGDYNSKQPMISPSWAPDGSLYVQGWTSMNNGIYKVSADFTSLERIDPDLSNVSAPCVSPDGKNIAFIKDGEVWTMSINGENPTQLYSSLANLRMPVWSPDSKYIAAVSSGHICIIDIKSKTGFEITKSHYVGEDSQMCWRY